MIQLEEKIVNCEPTGDKMLLGNAFPMTLIRRHVVRIEECAIDDLSKEARRRGVVSYWGHENTRAAAECRLGVDLRPKSNRPAIVLDRDGYPMLDGASYRTCYVLSPNYRDGFRPAIGAEVGGEDIVDWNALKLTWD